MPAIIATATRATVPGGPLADLSLYNPGVYEVAGLGPGVLVWDKQTVRSRWVHGDFLVSATKRSSHAPLRIRVLGSSAPELDTRTRSLLDVFDQWSYDLTLTVDGVVHKWRCQPADYSPTPDENRPAGEYGMPSLGVFQHLYTFIVPRSPVPLAGSM